MVFPSRFPHTIYGVMRMTTDFRMPRRAASARANCLNLALFVTGALLGCAVMYLGGVGTTLSPAGTGETLSQALVSNGRFLLPLYLFAFIRWGAALVPPAFGLEGLLLGGTAAAVLGSMGRAGLPLMALMLLFRFLLVLPYGFLLGAWSVGQSLSYGSASVCRTWFPVLVVTLLVLALASLLECTVAQWLGCIYLLKFGV